jgi:sulfur-carrier protein
METKMNILVFGQLEEITGGGIISINPVPDTELLRESLYQLFPALKQKQFLVAVNQKIIRERTEINGDAQIALLPPFSGG